MDFTRFDALTFDCYGTLIDWERGILDALRPALSGADLPGDEALLELYAGIESAVQSGIYRPYREILFDVARTLGSELGIAVDHMAAPDFFKRGTEESRRAEGDSGRLPGEIEALFSRWAELDERNGGEG